MTEHARRSPLDSLTSVSTVTLQVDLLKKTFRAALGDSAKDVDINTIDGFQVLISFTAVINIQCSVAGSSL